MPQNICNKLCIVDNLESACLSVLKNMYKNNGRKDKVYVGKFKEPSGSPGWWLSPVSVA